MDLAVAIAGGFVEDHRDPSREEDLTGVGICQPHRLLEDLAGLDPPTCPLLAREFPVQRRGVLTNHEESLAACDPEQETGRAEVAVVDPDVLGTDDLQDLAQQRPLLCMAVLAEDHVGDEHQARVEHDQRLTRQGPGADRAQLLDAVLRGSEMISVKNLDAIARQQWGGRRPSS